MCNVMQIALQNFEDMITDRGYIPIDNGNVEEDIEKRLFEQHYKISGTKFKSFSTIIDSTVALTDYSHIILDESYQSVLVIYTNTVTVAHRAIEKKLMHKVEIWSINSLMVNPTKHILHPKIEKMPKGFHCEAYKIPKISLYDATVRYYRFRQRDVLKITDKNGVVSFRRVG